MIEIQIGAIQSVYRGGVIITNPSEPLYVQDLMLARTVWNGRVWLVVNNKLRSMLADAFVKLRRTQR